MHGLIPAAGGATRLGPIGAQLNKALVTIGQKPAIVRQIQQLIDVGCSDVTVVVSPRMYEQVLEVIERSGLNHFKIRVVVQGPKDPGGPGGAIFKGTFGLAGSVVVVMADTVLSNEDIPIEPDTASVAPAPSTRVWAWHNGKKWTETEAPAGTLVSIGAFCFKDVTKLHRVTATAGGDLSELKMATILNELDELKPALAESWQDIGDLDSLAKTQEQRFNSRSYHQMQVKDGVLRKTGASDAEKAALLNPPFGLDHLYPRVLAHDDDWYEIEYIDMPSLSELWLYWPGLPDTWKHITNKLFDNLEHIWCSSRDSTARDMDSCHMWQTKLQLRYLRYNTGPNAADVIAAWDPHDQIIVNSKTLSAGPKMIYAVLAAMKHFVDTANLNDATIHGDPFFGNVLFSARMGYFKFIDPRGKWGSTENSIGDWRYDVGKIAFSTVMAPITHGLFECEGQDRVWHLDILPRREQETAAVDLVIEKRSGLTRDQISLLKTFFLLSSAPLHSPEEANAMYLSAVLEWNS